MLQMRVHRAKLKKSTIFRKIIMTLQDLLDKVCGDASDNVTSRKLGISRQLFSAYRTGRRLPTDEALDKMIELSGLDAVDVYHAAYAEKIQNPIVAKAFRESSHLSA